MKKIILIFIFNFTVYNAFSQNQGHNILPPKPKTIPVVKDSIINVMSIVPDGDVKSAIAGNTTTIATGSLGFTYQTIIVKPDHSYNEKSSIGGFVSIASTFDTLKAKVQNGKVTNQESFGSALLLPSGSGQLALSFLINGQISLDNKKFHNYFRGYIGGSTSHWNYNNENKQITNISAGAYFQKYLINVLSTGVENNTFRLGIYGGVTTRILGGDITIGGDSALVNILGTKKTFFVGPELGLAIEVNSIRVNLACPIFSKNIAGFSHGQFIPSFGISVPIILPSK
jgi:hypothetical protein